MFRTAVRIAASSANYTGATGRVYAFKQLIQERPHTGRVWLARSNEETFVLKDIPENIFTAFQSGTRDQIKASPYLRLPIDRIPGQRIFVYRFFTEDFLSIVKNQIPLQRRKEILKASLQGLVDLHRQDVVHLDVKPDNVMADVHGSGSEAVVERAQLTDLENAAYLPEGRCIKGMLPGNEHWRSPEGHLRGELNKSTDIFSFGAMCVYAVLGRVIFGPDEDMKRYTDQGAVATMVCLQRQVSYFGDRNGINGLLTHVGDDELSLQLLSNAYDGKDDNDHGYKHFSTWPEIKEDDTFKDLVLTMMSLDPKRRTTAKDALEHPWFNDVKLSARPQATNPFRGKKKHKFLRNDEVYMIDSKGAIPEQAAPQQIYPMMSNNLLRLSGS